jgi:hypothetical protein
MSEDKRKHDTDATAENIAEHCSWTIMMNVPAGTDEKEFLTLVVKKMEAKTDEKIKDLTRRRSM